MTRRAAGSGRLATAGAARAALALVAITIALGWLTGTAAAAPKPFNGFIGGAASTTIGGFLPAVRDVAVYTAGTPAVADDKLLAAEGFEEHSRIQRMDRHGNFERLWGRDVIRAGFPGNVGTGFEICTAAVTGAEGCGPGNSEGTLEGELNISPGIAVNQSTGHVYVIDAGNRRVQEFDLDGQFIRAWGWGVDTGAAAFEVCVASCRAGVVNPSVPADNDNPGQFADIGQMPDQSTSSIAVSPAAPHDVFVTDPGNRRVMQFEADGSFLRAWGYDVSPGGAAQFETCESAPPGCQAGVTPGGANGQFAPDYPRHVAVDDGGMVYASDSADDHRLVRFDSDPAPAPATPVGVDALPSLGLLGDGRTTGLELDPGSGNLLVVRDRSTDTTVADVKEIADPDADLSGGPPDPVVVDTHVVVSAAEAALGAATRGLGFDPASGNLYLPVGMFNTTTLGGKLVGCTGESSFCSGLIVLAHTVGAPGADLDAPSDVGAESVVLTGLVSPSGGVARYRFQVSADGSTWTDASPPRWISGPDGDQPVSAEVSGLEPATLYRVRILLTKQTGVGEIDTHVSNEDVFLTDAAAPEVTTLGSTNRTDTSVRLRGLVDPQGSSTSYRFEYGPAGGSFDRHVPVPDAEAGAGNSPTRVVMEVSGLQPSTAYHYRIVASNFVGSALGEPVTFVTEPAPPLPEPPAGRGYELVSPADKLSGVGAGVWYHGPAAAGLAGAAAHDGERFSVQSTFGSVISDGKFSFANDGFLAERTPRGWVGEPAASRRAYGSQTLVFQGVIAATPDLSTIAYSNPGLKLFPEQETWIKEQVGAILYLRDWESGKWELVAPSIASQEANLQRPTIADDGKSIVAFGLIRGLFGPGDPTNDLAPGVVNVFMDEVPSGPSDVFPGVGVRSFVNACTPGTEIPARVDAGGGVFRQAAQDCPAPDAGDDFALISEDGATLGLDTEGVISENGSRVFFMTPVSDSACTGTGPATDCPPQLYVRQRVDSDTVATRWISRTEVTQANGASSDQDASLMDRAEFEGASKDGDKVFFSTASPLTADDPNGQGNTPPAGGVVLGPASQTSQDLYMYDMPDAPGADPADGELTRISAGPTGEGDCNSVSDGDDVGALRYASDDGSRLYFVCAAPLDGVPLSGDGTITSPGGTPSGSGAVNLYAYDAARPTAQRWRFVARLPRDSALGRCATEYVRPGNPIAAVNEQNPDLEIAPTNCLRGTRDGSFVTFLTDGQLTDDDPDSSTGDIYAYDAARDELTRASAPQGGVGGSYPCLVAASGPRCYGDDGVGPPTGVLGLPKLGVAEAPDGRRMVFFESRSRLLPADEDSAYDVYKWSDGVLSLISTGGSSTDGAFYAGSDRTGQNVYLATRDRLTWQDHDAVLDVYTARVGGGINPPDDTGETCDPTADQCQGAGQPPTGSQSDSDQGGEGNLPTPARVSLTLADPSTRARRRALRTGKLQVRVITTGPAKIVVGARARLGGKGVKAAPSATRTLAKAGRATLTLRLARVVRQRLRKGRKVQVTLTARAAGARTVTVAFTLRRT